MCDSLKLTILWDLGPFKKKCPGNFSVNYKAKKYLLGIVRHLLNGLRYIKYPISTVLKAMTAFM